jgi:hypothetical protein
MQEEITGRDDATHDDFPRASTIFGPDLRVS